MRKATNIFKAQFGGGTEQADSAKMMTQSIYSAIKKGQTPKQVYEALIARKVNQDMALQLVTSVVNFMMQNGELEQEDLEEQEQQEAQAAQQKAEEEAAVQAQMEADKDAEAEAQMNTYNEQSLAVANEDPGYDEEAQAVLGFQDGGGLDMAAMYSQMQQQAPDATKGMDSLVAATAGTQSISFPGIEEYVYPYMPILSDEPNFDPSMFAKYGGAARKKFTKNVMGLLKKAEGGEDEVLNDTTASQFDTLDGEVKKKQSAFVNAVGEEAKKLKINEWFNKLQQTGDPMLEQLTSPAPEVPNPAEEQMKRGGSKKNKKYQRLLKQANKLLNINEMPGTLGLPVDYYNKFNSGFRDQRFGTIDSEDLAKFTNQQKEVSINPSRGYMPYIDVYESGFFGRPKKYRIGYTPVGIQPKDKSSEQQAEEATVKNNLRYLPNPGYEGSEAPAGTMLDIVDDVSVKPISFGADWREHGKTAFGVTPNSQIATPILMGGQQYVQPEVTVSNTKIIGDAKVMKKGKGSQPGYVQYEIQVPAPNGQMFAIQTEFNREPTEADIQELIQSATEKETGGIVGSGDPSVPSLSQFVYGGMDFPEESKNTNDPYFTDTYPMQMAQQGGDPTAFTHYTHGADDIFHDQMNMMVAQNGAEVQAFDPSQMYNLDYLKTLVKDLKHEDKLARRDGRRSARATNTTLRDYLLPVNPMLRYSGSWAEQMGMPYNYETGLAYEGSLDGAKLATRDVTDRGIFGRPKEWTDYYILNSDGEPAFNPNQQPQFNQEEVSQEMQDQEDYGKLGMRARMAVNKGERKTERQLERAERKGYNEPTPNLKNQSLEELAASLGYPDVETLIKASKDETLKNFPEELRKQMMEYQDGGQTNFYTVQGSDGVYRKVNGKWEVDWNRSGNFQPLSKGDLAKRTAVLNSQAKPLYDSVYDDLYSTKQSSYSAKPKPSPNKKLTQEDKAAQEKFEKSFDVKTGPKEMTIDDYQYPAGTNAAASWESQKEQLPQAYKDVNDFYSNWYMGRATIPEFRDVALQRYRALNPQVTVQAQDEFEKDHPGSVFAATYRKTTSDKNKDKANQIFIANAMYPDAGSNDYYNEMLGDPKDALRYFTNEYGHEKSHWYENNFPQEGTNPDSYADELPSKSQLYAKGKPTRDYFEVDNSPEASVWTNDRFKGVPAEQLSYLGKPTELRARLNVWRMQNNIDPTKKYTTDEIRKIMDDNIKNFDDSHNNVRELYKLINNNPEALKEINDRYVSNDSDKELNMAADGGQADNFYDQLNESLYNPIEEYRRGGRLRRASMGMSNTSVAYNDNPIFNNGLDPNVVLGNQDQAAPIQTPDYWSNMTGTQTQFNPPQQPTDQITINQNDQAQGTVQQKQDPIKLPNIIGVDRRRQDMTTFDPEAMLNTGNAAARGVLGFINNKKDRQQEQEMYANNFNPMNIYGKKERMDRGDWEVNQGSYRMNQTGADRLGRSKQYGGQAFNEGEELYMTEEEIKEFLANGGQLEYL